MALCKICKKDTAAAATDGNSICQNCATVSRLHRTMPPPRRPRVPCLRCNGLRFIRSLPREFNAESTLHLTVALEPNTRPEFFGHGAVPLAPDPRLGKGQLEMYVCAGCGYVEWYCLDPEAIPIGIENNTELIDLTPDAPYR